MHISSLSSKAATGIIVGYRSASIIRDCALSLLKDPAIERVIVVNNSPNDGTALQLAGLAGVLVIELPSNLGYGRAINSVRDHALSEFVVLANPDTEQYDDTVSKAIAFLECHPRAGMLGPRMLTSDGRLYRNSQYFISPLRMVGSVLRSERLGVQRPKHSYSRPHLTQYVIGSFVICRREALDSVGWFDETIFLFGEDQDLCRRLDRAGWEVWYAPLGLVRHAGGYSWRQLDDNGRRFFSEARERELREGGHAWAAYAYRVFSRVRRGG